MFPWSYVEVVSKIDVSTVGLCILTLLTIYVTHWLYRWRNPKCNGVLPPGSMGLPFIGETLGLFLPKSSIEVLPFIKTRIQRYGPIFRTNLAGRPFIVSADQDFNYFLLKQDEKLVDQWMLDTFEKAFPQSSSFSEKRKYARNLTIHQFGIEPLKHKLIPYSEDAIRKSIHAWSSKESMEVKSAINTLIVDLQVKELCSNDLDDAPFKLSDECNNIIAGLMSFPLNIPGTAHHKCLKSHKQVTEMMSNLLEKRRLSSDDCHEDFLGHIIKDASTKSFLSDEFIIQCMSGIPILTSDALSTACSIAFKLIAEHPDVLKELTAEHEEMLKKRENINSPLTWDEYKSMTYTHQVIKEVLRFANVTPGLFRRAVTDISFNGYTIPSGWGILLASSAVHMSSTPFEDPLTFNPKRWQGLRADEIAKSFMPFGFGMKQCAGAEYSRVFLSIFLHVLVTKYSWKLVKGGKIKRAPLIGFPEGLHYKITAKQN